MVWGPYCAPPQVIDLLKYLFITLSDTRLEQSMKAFNRNFKTFKS